MSYIIHKPDTFLSFFFSAALIPSSVFKQEMEQEYSRLFVINSFITFFSWLKNLIAFCTALFLNVSLDL